ncbi:motility associated factor glycosyltransferase family protein [Butyrivibrio sp. JL13D10]|uniref:motility associated factor glycosyltransferase family protein n=1 Tax=Butyrivibrio sp. JL13D10 TaxID=3236815 RepID=UPI0038B5DBB0
MIKSVDGLLRPDVTLREKNFNVLKKRYGKIPHIDKGESEKYSASLSKDKGIVFYINDAIPAGSLRLNSLYSPRYEAGRWAEKQSVPMRRTTVVLMGFSSGVYLDELIKRFRSDTTFFVYEPSESFFSFVCAYVDVTELLSNPRVNLYISESACSAMADDLLSDLAGSRSEAISIISPFYSNNDEFNNICHEAESALASKKEFQKGRSRQVLRCRMYAWNHMDRAYVLSDLKDSIPQGVTAVIVSAGPSLERNGSELKNIKGHAFIICTDRAVSVLDKVGIVPDMIISMDAEKSSDYLDYEAAKNAYLLCSYQTNIETQKKFEGRCIYFHALSFEQKLIGDRVGREVTDHGGNVAGAAFVVCRELGISRIVLIGQDLAYTGGRHHADDIEDGNPDMTKRLVEGVDGTNVETNEMWISFRDFFERQIGLYPEIEVIDATEGGAKIHGAKDEKLSVIAGELKNEIFNSSGILDGMHYVLSADEQKMVKQKLQNWIKDIDEVRDKAIELETICRNLINACKYSDINDIKYSKKKEKLSELKLSLHRKTVYGLMEHFWIEDMYSIPDLVLFIRDNKEALPVLEAAEKYYAQLPSDCESLKEELAKAIDD